MSPTGGGGDDDDRDRVGDDDEAFAEAVRGARPLGLRDARVTAPQPAIAEPRRKRQGTATPQAAFVVE